MGRASSSSSPEPVAKKEKKSKKSKKAKDTPPASDKSDGDESKVTFSKKKRKDKQNIRKRASSTESDSKKKEKSKSKKKKRSPSPDNKRKRKVSRSPKRRSKSPKRRSRSPKRRSPSPRRRSPVHRRRTPSPRKRTPSPRRRSPSPRRRKRSRSPRRSSPRRSPPRRSRSPRRRSRERKRRSPSREKKRDKSRSKSRSKSTDKKKKSASPAKPSTKRKVASDSDSSNSDIDTQLIELINEKKKEVNKFQSEMEKEMIKRKEKIEAWRLERKKGGEPAAAAAEGAVNKKQWSLEDDAESEEEEEKKEGEEAGDVSDDPLDAFMDGVSTELKTLNKSNTLKKVKKVVGGRSIEVAVKVKPKEDGKKKGLLMSNDNDAMEYSSEDVSEDDLDDMNYAGYKTKKKRELEMVDHSKVEYDEFRKDFYVEVPELAKITDAQLADMYEGLDNMQVKGRQPPKPIKSWIQAGISMKVLNVLKKYEYTTPTPIQAISLPTIMAGRDLIGIAKTGSGKTLAFLVPMFRHIMDQRPLEMDEGPIAILLSPTRELAMQTFSECKKFCKPLKLRCVCVYGGTGISEQIAELKRGCEIIVCTPGRMIDMLTANSGKVTNCKRVTYVVFDEADRMFDLGFEPQVMRIIGTIRPDRQTVMFSATFPRQMEALARKILVKPVEVTTGGRSKVCADVDQNVIIIEDEEKFHKLMEILGHFGEGQSLIFVHTQERADNILKDLMDQTYNVMALHGGMDQHDRDSVIQDFKHGNVRVLVATSVAARGLDVKALRLVVNYDCPNHYEDYVHRVGRTGRAGMKGTAYTFIQRDQERHAGDLINALELSGARVPTELEVLWKEYVAEQESQGNKVEKNRGFSGKGYKFNQEESALHDEKKQLQKFSLGLQDSDDEDILQQKQDELDKAIEDVMGGKKGIKMITETAANPTKKIVLGKGKTIEEKVGHLQGVERAQAVAMILNKVKVGEAPPSAGPISLMPQGPSVIDPTQHATSAFMKGETVNAVSGKGLAAQIAASINAKYNHGKADEDMLLLNPALATPCKVEEEIEINDLPQQARYRITSKDAICAIQEYSECALTVRGTFYPTNKNPPEGMRKLYICIEGAKERSVALAKMEIKRMIKEELSKAQMFSFGSNGSRAGRYSVL